MSPNFFYKYGIVFSEFTNVSANFQNAIMKMLTKHLNIFVIIYLEDILLFSESKTIHTNYVHQTLQTFQKNDIKINFEKGVSSTSLSNIWDLYCGQRSLVQIQKNKNNTKLSRYNKQNKCEFFLKLIPEYNKTIFPLFEINSKKWI